ncbi:MAG: nucleotidyltransferase substrate binding protein [Rhodospirillaceae bacterium]
MVLNTDHLHRCVNTLDSALVLYRKAEPNSVEREVFRSAIVKNYELAQETTLKLLRRALREFDLGRRALEAMTAREVLRLSAQHGLIEPSRVEPWFAYRDNRNSTAHEYGEHFAKETLLLLPAFLEDVKAVEQVLRTRFGVEA